MKSNTLVRHVLSAGAAFLRSCPRIALQESSYPGLPRKCLVRRYVENLILRFRDGAVCGSYNALGLDVRGRSLFDTFVDGQRERLVMSWLSREPVDYTVLLTNKYLFFEYMHAHGIPVVPVLGHVVNGQCYIGEKSTQDKEFVSWLGQFAEPFFLKIVDGWCGQMVRKIHVTGSSFISKDGPVDVMGAIHSGHGYIVQPVIGNAAAIRQLNPDTLNTIRIATAQMSDGSIELWDPGLVRIGRRNSDVDNYNAGGVFVAIREDGALFRRAGSKGKGGRFTWMEKHPDSQIVFDGIKVPYYAAICDLVLSAHKLFPTIKTIGWDVAVTEDGPMLLEGNHDWDLEFMQIARGVGQMKRYREVYCN